MTASDAGSGPSTSLVHIGMCVPDLDAGIAWYRDVLGFALLAPAVELRPADGEDGEAAADVFGPRFGAVRMAHLVGANGAAIELFEFLEPRQEPRADGFTYWRVGVSHICVQADDVQALADRIVAAGGRQTSAVWATVPGGPFRFVWCEDPFGYPVEIYSHPHAEVFAQAGAGSDAPASR